MEFIARLDWWIDIVFVPILLYYLLRRIDRLRLKTHIKCKPRNLKKKYSIARNIINQTNLLIKNKELLPILVTNRLKYQIFQISSLIVIFIIQLFEAILLLHIKVSYLDIDQMQSKADNVKIKTVIFIILIFITMIYFLRKEWLLTKILDRYHKNITK